MKKILFVLILGVSFLGNSGFGYIDNPRVSHLKKTNTLKVNTKDNFLEIKKIAEISLIEPNDDLESENGLNQKLGLFTRFFLSIKSLFEYIF